MHESYCVDRRLQHRAAGHKYTISWGKYFLHRLNEYSSKYPKAPKKGRASRAGSSTLLGFDIEASAKEWLIVAFKPVEIAQSLRKDNEIFSIWKTSAQFCAKTNNKQKTPKKKKILSIIFWNFYIFFKKAKSVY